MEGLTPRQQQVLEFIRESLRANGYPPTVREICAALNLSSPSTVHAHLANLERLGLIKRDPSKPRALDVVQDIRPRRPLPLVGRVAAGQPILADENIEEYVDVPAFLRRDDDDFVLRVRGDSMIDAGIFNGDFIVVHAQDQAGRADTGRDFERTRLTIRHSDRGRRVPENRGQQERHHRRSASHATPTKPKGEQ